MALPKIRATCRKLKEEGISLYYPPDEVSGQHYPPTDDPKHEYQNLCEDVFLDARAMQEYYFPRMKPRLWSASQIEIISDFARSLGLDALLMIAPRHYSMRLAIGRVFVLGLGLAMYNDPNLYFTLDHEKKHLHDRSLAKSKLKICTRLPNKERAQIFLELMREGLSKDEQLEFDDLVRDVIGDDLASAISLIAEAFRYGEQIHDVFWIEYLKSPDFYHFKSYEPIPDFYKQNDRTYSERHDLVKPLMKAALTVAGRWEWFTNLADFAPNSDQNLDPRAVRFFELAIRGASRALTHHP